MLTQKISVFYIKINYVVAFATLDQKSAGFYPLIYQENRSLLQSGKNGNAGKGEAVMKIFKRIPTLIAVLMPVFLFSIGFSSWTIFGPLNPVTAEGSFEAYEVGEYVSWASTDMFEYTSLFFVDGVTDESNVSTQLGKENVGRIIVTYNFTDLAKAQAQTDTGLTVKFTLSTKNLKQVDGVNPKIFTATNTKATVGTNNYSPSVSTDVFEFSHTFTGDIGNSFTLTYTFTTTVGQGFRNDFGRYFLNNYGTEQLTTEFVTSAEAEVNE